MVRGEKYLRAMDDNNMYFSKTLITLRSNSALFLLLCNQNSCKENGTVWKEGVNALQCTHKFSANSVSVASFNFVFMHSVLSTTTQETRSPLIFRLQGEIYFLYPLLEQFEHWFTSNFLVPGLIMSGKCINMVKATGDGKPFHITHFEHTLNSFISAFYGRQTIEKLLSLN